MHIDTERTDLEYATTLPARCYVDAAVLEHERRVVFGRSWQLVGHHDQLTDTGDHIVTQIGNVPTLLVRGGDRALRGFVNVCRHRAGPLALCDGRGARLFHCRYHGWTYDLEGRLRSAPEMDRAAGFEPDGIRLPVVRVHEWQGLVFAALDASTPSFETVYAGIAERIAPLDLATMRFRHSESYDIACNWKVYVDNFLEGYHLPHVHPGLSRVLDYRSYSTQLQRWYSLQTTPMRNNDVGYGGERANTGEVLYFFIYPNVMLNITPGRLQTNRVIALDAGHCRVEFDYYYSGQQDVQSRADTDRGFSDQVQREDIAICEIVQRGLASGTYETGHLCPAREQGVWHFQNLLRAAYADGEEPV